jgi:hypothetical protein
MRKRNNSTQKSVRNQIVEMTEDEQLTELMEFISPRNPYIRVYRVDPHTKRHTYLGNLDADGFDLSVVREAFGSGTFLVRSVRSNGKYGPSRIVGIAPRPQRT